MPQHICAETNLVALRRFAVFCRHNAGIFDQNIERFHAKYFVNFLHGHGHAVEVGKVANHRRERARVMAVCGQPVD